MKTVMITLCLALFALSAAAQTSTVSVKATWVQQNAVADAQSFTYVLKDNSVTPATLVAVTNVACVVAQGVVTCAGDVPLPAAGPHAFQLLASSPDGNLTAASPILVGVMPGAPQGFKIKITVVITP